MAVTARTGTGRYVDVDWRDPHLHYSVPVDAMITALPNPKQQANRLTRFWRVSETTPDKAWVIVFTYGRPAGQREGWQAEAVLVPLWGLYVSQRPADPPPMPEWATED